MLRLISVAEFPVPILAWLAVAPVEMKDAGYVEVAVVLAAVAWTLKLILDFVTRLKEMKAGNGDPVNVQALKAQQELVKEATRLNLMVTEISSKVNTLYDWHKRENPDEPGVKVWWVGGNLRRQINNIEKMVSRLPGTSGRVRTVYPSRTDSDDDR